MNCSVSSLRASWSSATPPEALHAFDPLQSDMITDPALSSAAFSAAFVAALAFAAAWWSGQRRLRTLRRECERLRSLGAEKESSLARTLVRCDELQGELGALHDKLGHDETQMGQLRDLVKVHVARRREFDEWANPIRASLGDAFGHTLRTLKEQIARQEFALKRQERIVADAETQYLGKRDELESMRRELTLKNYHIAALNERFIRVEERMQDLNAQVAAIGLARGPRTERDPATASTATSGLPISPETERFGLGKGESRDWMEVLDNWHRQLHERLDRLDELQAQLRTSSSRAGAPRNPSPGRPGEAGAA
jgi:predicted  nucleic acid-binding Zn-ribbon protein